MPNWCHNRVTFSGTTEEINNIIEFVAGDTLEEPFSLNAIIPMPEESKKTGIIGLMKIGVLNGMLQKLR